MNKSPSSLPARPDVAAPASGGSGLRMRRCFVGNAPCTYGVFPVMPSRFNGDPIIRFGTRAVAQFSTEAEALAWIAQQEAR